MDPFSINFNDAIGAKFTQLYASNVISLFSALTTSNIILKANKD